MITLSPFHATFIKRVAYAQLNYVIDWRNRAACIGDYNSVRFHNSILSTVGLCIFLLSAHASSAKDFRSTDILVLGDSQLSFGAGPVLKDFFENLPARCASALKDPADIARLDGLSYGMLGTRSTSLQSWVQSSGPAWKQLCRKDKKHGVNASSWGTLKTAKRRFIQVGEGRKFQVCKRGRTPLQALLAKTYYQPKVLMFFVGGNGAGRLAGSLKKTRTDVDRLVSSLPPQTGCLFMTTVPIFTRKRNRTRLRAQKNLRTAFAKHGERCAMVEGFNKQTLSAIEGKSQYFRRRKSGRIKDPFHPDKRATQKFMNLTRPALCRALVKQLATTSS